ncbi:AraC family transcriptional regulator [Paenibacillus mucilaginosus 3016]|uniref:AraC family transcriptional regulator n=1 Tax=Paenibacillus mucilaginosus 3016 TaxID=1116391 RepID=H6N9R1_9BACL|nr:AraC family transcriptional regulator [Paenibacillus mucilaginosus]AFC28218.1 AraC family transcriptional regulator [Paenibacillus mucilaginosus 3016]
MRIHKRFNTIFHRLVFSYILLIILTAIFMGIASYLYFSNHFNREIEKAHEVTLENVSSSLRHQVFDRMVKTYAELTVNKLNAEHVLFFFTNPVKQHNAKIGEAHSYLQYLASVSEGTIRSIDMYYKHNRMLISSERGYRQLQGSEPWPAVEWLDGMDFSESSLLWLDSAPLLSGGAAGEIILAASYPYVPGETNQGYVVIRADAEALARQLGGSSLSEHGSLLVAGPHTLYGEMQEELPSEVLQRLRAAGAPSGSFLETIGGSPYMLTYVSLPHADWKLAGLTPLGDFYRGRDTAALTLLAIGAAAIGLGILLSCLFSARIYHPIRSLAERARDLFRDGSPQRSGREENEVLQINGLIDNLSVKVTRLEHTLQANLPLVKQSLVTNLLGGSPVPPAELEGLLGLLGIAPPPYWSAVHFRFDELSFSRLTVENRQFLLYHFIEQFEDMNTGELVCLGVQASGRGVSALVLARQPDTAPLLRRIDSLQSFTCAHFSVVAAAAVGSWLEEAAGAALAFREAEAMLQYRFLFPSRELFHGKEWLERERSGRALDGSWLAQWVKALRAGDVPLAERLLADWAEQLRTGGFSAAYARQSAGDALHAYRQYLFEVHLAPEEVLTGELSLQPHTPGDLAEWQRWLGLAAARASALLRERTAARTDYTVDKVKAYIDAHLADDLSLNAAAEQVSLNPAYLSRMFKAATGINYVDYVTSERMNRAKTLLSTTDTQIERIALLVGYANPAYFSKKFKEAFGLSPSEFRARRGDREDQAM